MGRLERIDVTTDVTRTTAESWSRPHFETAEPVGHLINTRRRWEVHCDVPECSVTPDDFVTTYLRPSAALDQLLDHLEEDHGVKG